MEFAYDGGGLGKGGTVALYVDGSKVGEGRVERTVPLIFSADETTDVGSDSATPVSDDYDMRIGPLHRAHRLGRAGDRRGRRGRRPPHHARGALPRRDGAPVARPSGMASAVAAESHGSDREGTYVEPLSDADRAAVALAAGPRGAPQAGPHRADRGAHRLQHHRLAAARQLRSSTSSAAACIAVLFIAALNLLVRPVILGLVAEPLGRRAGRPDPALPGGRHLAARPVRARRSTFNGGFIGALIVSFVFGFIAGRHQPAVRAGRGRLLLRRARADAREPPARTSSAPTSPASSSSSSTACPTTCCRTRCAPVACPTMAQLDPDRDATSWATGTRCCPRPPPPARRASCTATTTASPTSAGGRRRTRQLLVANHPEDATEIERRVSNGEGLLSPGGASISNIFTGDGDRAFLVMSTIKVKERGLGQSEAFAWFFVSPYNYLTMIGQVPRRGRQGEHPVAAPGARRHRAPHGPSPRLPVPLGARRHERRAASAGHVARHPGDGPRHARDLHGLHRLRRDRPPQRSRASRSRSTRSTAWTASCGRCSRRPRTPPRPYRFVILADHGQSLGATFLQRYGVTLQDVVRSLMGGKASVAAATAQIEDWGQLNTFLGEVSADQGRHRFPRPRGVAQQHRGRRHGRPGPERRRGHARGRSADPATVDRRTSTERGRADAEPADLIVVAGGNLALIYFNASEERMTLEDDRGGLSGPGRGARQPSRHRRPDGPLGRARPARAWAARASTTSTRIAWRARTRWRSTASTPSRPCERLDDIEHVGDIAVISMYDPETEEIAAFEELIGAHGGLGGAQTRPFLLYPADWELDLAPLIGAPMVYQQLRTLDGAGAGHDVRPDQGGCRDERRTPAIRYRARADRARSEPDVRVSVISRVCR